jgi:hypothetical protein
MKTFTRKELIEMGATFPFLRMGFDLVEREDED